MNVWFSTEKMSRIKKILVVLICLSLCACLKQEKVAEEPEVKEAVLVFINVFKADAALIQIDGKNFLIDSGSQESFSQITAILQLLGVEKIDAVILSHGDKDHIGGWGQLCRSQQISQLYISSLGEIHNTGVKALAQEYAIKIIELDFFQEIQLSENCSFLVLAPETKDEKDDNNNSLVLMFEILGNRVLFTGDMKEKTERQLLKNGIDLQATILKVAHHGQDDSSSAEFIQKVKPLYAIISTASKDRPHSAAAEVIQRLQDSKVLITEDYSLGIFFKLKENRQVQIIDLNP